VFSLGAVIYYAATGDELWGTGSAAAIVYRIVHDRPDLRDLPSDLHELVNRCLEKDPAKRPALTAVLARFGDPELMAATDSGSSMVSGSAPRGQDWRWQPSGLSPAQVPAVPYGFAGRAAELRWLETLLPKGPAEASGESPSRPLVVITGTAGVGKTALAIRFARQAGPHFPDGQLYVNLHGFGPASAPVSPRTALQGFFDALGVPSRHIPSGLEAQSALLRSLLDGKRMLLLLDNAHDADQVRPLLPGSSGAMVVVTSRSQLTGLVVADGARPLALGVLDAEEAAELLARRLGGERVTAEPDAVATLVRQCAGLPLALGVTCARAVTRPRARLADLTAELADARGRLDALSTGEVTTDLRAVFSWSIDKLSVPAARTFRLLGLHPGPEVTAAAVASLTATPLPRARAALAELTRASLLTEESVGRFGCHDLLRAYAAEQAATTLSDAERDLARRRAIDHYLRTAAAAAARLYPGRGRIALPSPLDGVVAEEFDGEEAYEAALAWFSAEHRVLHNMLDQAAAHHDDEQCWKLAWYWTPPLKRRGRTGEVLTVQSTALRAAERLADTEALAHVHYDLGHVSVRLGDYSGADKHLRRSLGLYTQLGDHAGIGQVRHGLAILRGEQNRYEEALEHSLESLRLRRSLSDRSAVAYSENGVGWIQAHLGQHDEALRHCHQALEIHRETGSRSGLADTLDSIAYIYTERADYQQALAYYEQALAMYRLIEDPDSEARCLLSIGDTQLALRQPDDALRSWEQALALLSRIPGADTRDAAARITRE
jgi:tetratricopeptide (TPR) repeat protein